MDIMQVLSDMGIAGGKRLVGDAQPGDVRAGKTFSNEDSNENVGTLPVQSTGAQTVTPGTIDIVKGSGIYDGPITIKGDANLASTNIKTGINVFGVIGNYDTEATNPIAAGSVLSGKIGFVNGTKITGTIPVKSGVVLTAGTTDAAIPAGYYDGTTTAGKIVGDADLVAANIKTGLNILGVTGNYDTEATNPAAATQIRSGKIAFVNGTKITGTLAVQSTTAQTVTPGTTDITKDAGIYDGAITVKGDANLVSANVKAGVTMFGVTGKSSVVETSDATATAGEILAGQTAYVNGSKVIGAMKNRNTQANDPTWSGTGDNDPTGTGRFEVTATYQNSAGATTPALYYCVPDGYYNGAKAWIYARDNNYIAANIKSGVSIFGLTGTFTADATATAAQIRSGQTAYVNGSKITGTLAVQATTAQTITPGTTDVVKPAGIYDGAITIKGDANLVSTNIKAGVTMFGVTGNSNVVDTSAGTATAGQIRSGAIAFVDGAQITGTLAVQATTAQTITPGTTDISKAPGIYDGAITIKGDANLVSANIKSGATIFGVAGKSSVVETSDATATAGQILAGQTAYINGSKITGTMVNQGDGVSAGSYAAWYNTGNNHTYLAVRVPLGAYINEHVSTPGYQEVQVLQDTLISGNVKAGVSIFGVAGKSSVVDTADAIATAAQIRSGQTAYVNGSKITGTLAVQATTAQTIIPGTTAIVKPAGIYDGAITIAGDGDLVSANLKAGLTIFGVAGSFTADATAVAGDILSGKTAYVNGSKLTGTMPNRSFSANGNQYTNAIRALGDWSGSLCMAPQAGYYDGAVNANGFGEVLAYDANYVSANIRAGVSIFGVSGKSSVVDTADATIPDANWLLTGASAYKNGTKINGIMPNNGAVTMTPSSVNQSIAGGYHNGSGYVVGDADLVSANIRAGVSIFGVTGSTLKYYVGDTLGTNVISEQFGTVWSFGGVSQNKAEYDKVNNCVYTSNGAALQKVDANGSLVWTVSLTDVVSGLAVDNEGNVYTGDWDGYITKFNTSGTKQWAYLVSGAYKINGIAVDNKNACVWSCNTNGLVQKVYFTGSGSTSSYVFSGGGAMCIAVDYYGYVYVGGYDSGGANYVKKCTSGLGIAWTFSVNTTVISVEVDEDQNVYIGSSGVLTKVNSNTSATVWSYTSFGSSIQRIELDGGYVWGVSTDTTLRKLDTRTGALIQSTTFSKSLTWVSADGYGNVFVAGTDYYLRKMNTTGYKILS